MPGWFRRMDLGVIALLARLGASANWHRMAMETWVGTPPSSPLGKAHAQWLAAVRP